MVDLRETSFCTEVNLWNMTPFDKLKISLSDAQKDHDITHLSVGRINNRQYTYLFNGLKHTQVRDLRFAHTDGNLPHIASGLKNSQIEKLRLYGKENNEGLSYLTNALKYSKIQYLDLSLNCLGDEGTRDLAIVLKDSRIQELYLSYNYIGDEGIRNLTNGLKGSPIQELDLSHNDIHKEGIRHLASALKDTQIRNLYLSCNYIGDSGTRNLAKGLKYSQIETLELVRNAIGDKGARYLADALKYSQIQELDLSDNGIGDKGVKYIKNGIKDTQVTSINVDGNYCKEETKNQINAVLEKNKRALNKMQDNFKHFVSKDCKDGFLGFQVHTATEGDIDIDKYLSFIQSIHDMPGVVPYMVNNSSVVFKKHEIVQFVQNISIHFCQFLSQVLEVDHSEYVNLLKKCEDMHLDYIVKDLLLNREACTIEASNIDVLYPYVYVLLNRYKQPLHLDNQVFKCNKQEIIEYFQDHPELEYAQEAIELLKNVNENKREKM